MKKLFVLMLTLCLCLCGCKKQQASTVSTQPAPPPQQEEQLVILYTADVHGAVTRPEYGATKTPMGYAALKAYADSIREQGADVLLVDGGDAGTGRQYFEQLGYFAAVPGQEELALELKQLQEAKTTYICCNLLDEATGEPVFEPYKIADLGTRQVAFVGITRLEQEAELLYAQVQKAIDDAQSEGADYVIAVGYLGMDPQDSPCASADVIANTTGLTAYLDARGHVVTQDQTLTDAGGKEVPVVAVGSELTNIGSIRLDLKKGTVDVTLVSDLTEEDGELLTLIEETSREETTEPTIEPTT